MSSTIPALLHDLQTGVARGINAPLVAYLFFRITHRDAFLGLGCFRSRCLLSANPVWYQQKHG